MFQDQNNKKFERMLNPRISVMSFNIWGNFYLSERINNLKNTLKLINSDIILFQEVTIENLQFLIETLPQYNYVKEEKEIYWQTESNIFWNKNIFNLINSGYYSFHHSEYPGRGLFWVRLSLKNQPNNEFIVSTSHLPWVGSNKEITTGINQRIECCRLILQFLNTISKPNEPIIFAGDLNDDYHPLRVLRGDDSISTISTTLNQENIIDLQESNQLQQIQQQHQESVKLYDVFELLDLPPIITHPVRPSDFREEMRVRLFFLFLYINSLLISSLFLAFSNN